MAASKEPRQNVKFALFALSGNQCAFPDCTEQVFQEDSIVSQIAHIHAQSTGGPRFNPEFTTDEVNALDNLLLLCGRHHKIIDDHPDKYPAEALRLMKKMHESNAVPTEPSALHKLIESLAHQSLPEAWWERPGLPRFVLHLASKRPTTGQWTFEIELEQLEGESVGDLHYSYAFGESRLEFVEPRLIRARKWRLQTLAFTPVGTSLGLHLRFWWSGGSRTIFYHWEKEADFQEVDSMPRYVP